MRNCLNMIYYAGSPKGKTSTEILTSISEVFTLNSFKWVKSLLVSFNVINWMVAGVGLWMFRKSQDFATYLLMLFVLNVFLFSVVYLRMEVIRKIEYVNSNVKILN